MASEVSFAQITTRPATAADEEFLFDLYCAVRAPEFAMLPVPEEQRRYIIRTQYEWQANAYKASYPGFSYQIVLLEGERSGRIWIARTDVGYELVDIAIHPRVQQRGIGRILLRRLQEEAASAQAAVHSSVAHWNLASLRLHESLGFRVASRDEMQLHLEWRS